MPKVKLSALVADMKGKANGSVFSKNQGGVYYRNNPSGGGKKSAKWDQQKSVLASVSATWKNLTQAQRDAWSAASINFPTTNAFGDVRIPSGYELFMRVNGVQASYGNSNLVLPPSVPTLPDPGIVQVEYSTLFQLNPNNRISLFDLKNPITALYLTNSNLIDTWDLKQDASFSGRWEYDFVLSGSLGSTSTYRLFFYGASDTEGAFFELLNSDPENPVLSFYQYNGGNQIKVTANVTPQQVLDGFHFIVETATAGLAGYYIYVDGLDATATRAESGTPISGDVTGDLIFGQPVGDQMQYAYFSDIRVYLSVLDPDQAYLVSQGYVLRTETILCDLTSQTAGVCTNWTNYDTDGDFSITNYTSGMSVVKSLPVMLWPNFSITTENPGTTNTALVVYASPPTSLGNTGSFNNYKALGALDWDGVTSLDLMALLKAKFGYIAPESQIRFYVQPYATQSGIIQLVKQTARRKSPHFKAGSEISAKVN